MNKNEVAFSCVLPDRCVPAQQNSYKEMADFVRLAKAKGAKCRFSLCYAEENSETSMQKENDVFNSKHPKNIVIF